MKKWYKQKTVWTAITGAVTALAGYFTGEISLTVCVGACFGAAAVICMRDGIEKSGPSGRNADKGESLK